MRIKLSDYIAEFLQKHDIDTVFTVTGGGAMHLNNSLGHAKGLHCVYNHHEQASAIAAEAYARINNKIAAVCVTTGPGGTNALTGVVGGWLDSIPMLIISGQVRYDTTARSTGLNLRAMGDQEFEITKAVSCMTKYCEMVIDPLEIAYCLEKALFLAKTGRPGPCWLDIPLNVQGSYIETDELHHFDAKSVSITNTVTEKTILEIIDRIKNAKRPVINAGSAIRLSNGYAIFRKLIEKLNIPVVTGWNSIDLLPNDHPLYVGRGGILGDRAGNFAVQNCDLLLSIGSRLSIRQVGYNYETWARNAFVIMVDVDEAELKKPTLHVELPICADVNEFMLLMDSIIGNSIIPKKEEWIKRCADWKKRYPVVQDKHYQNSTRVNVYAFIKELSSSLPENYVTVVSNGSACAVGSAAYTIKEGQRFIVNSAIASMGYGLPASIGSCVAIKNKELVCIEGDGSIQMNIQELQTIVTNKLPIKLFIINNNGYHSIRMTQHKFFGDNTVGIGPESNDLGFPEMKKLAIAYGYPYYSCTSNEELPSFINEVFAHPGYAICEVFVTTEQEFEPKSSAKRLEDGTLISAPLEDMSPFLPDDELKENMIIPMVGFKH